MFDTILCC